MITFIYSYCPPDEFPEILTITGQSYNDAVNKLIQKFVDKYDTDDEIVNIEDFIALQEYLNETYGVVISDLYDIEDF